MFYKGEYFFDSNENGIWDNGEDFTDTTNGQWDDWEIYMDANRSGSFDEGELFRDEPNGTWDEGEEWIDNININDKYDPPEPLSDGSQWKDNCGICIHSDVLGDNNEQPNSKCSKDCSPTPDDCVNPGIWQLDLDYKRQHPELDSLEFPIEKQGCWNGPKVPDSSFNAENPDPVYCCYPYLYTEQADTNRYQFCPSKFLLGSYP